jgi:hypothetical protein
VTVSCIVAVNSESWECVFGVKAVASATMTSALSVGSEARNIFWIIFRYSFQFLPHRNHTLLLQYND